MRLPESVRALIVLARRRLTAAWVLRGLVVALGIASTAASILVAVSRHWVIEWAELVGWSMIGSAVVISVVTMLVRRPTSARAALEIDRRLGGYDRISTALELTETRAELSEPEARQVAAAESWARARSIAGLVGLLPARPLPHLAILALAAVTALTLIPAATDAAVAQIRGDRASIEAEADRLDTLAEDAPPELAERLDALAEELRQAETLEQAMEALGEARGELLDSLDPADLARRTALAGLEQSLARDPIAQGADAVEQLEQLAEDLADLGAEEARDAAGELSKRAEDFAGVDQELSDALTEASDGLRRIASGDRSRVDDTAAALRRAADRAEAAADAGERSNATRTSASELRSAQERLDSRRSGSDGQGSGEGDGNGDGQGSGDGRGSGRGEGTGQGAGGGGGQGAGGQSGAGTGAGTGSGSVPSGQGDDDPMTDPSRGDIFDPPDFSTGDEVRVPVDGTDPGDLLGTADGRGIGNDAITPYSDRFSEYQRAALETLDSLTVPSSVESIVRDYFTRLEP